jgi:DNA-binding IclR family transcriptional regulator
MAIQSVQRALEILSLFSATQPQLGITDISKRMNLPKPTVHGLVQTLTEQGFLQRDPDIRKYSLGFKIHELGIFFASTLKINQAGTDLVQRLAKKVGNWVRLAIWGNDTMLITLNFLPDTKNLPPHQFGPRLPAHCCALGKAFLSTLNEQELNEFLERTPLLAYTQNTITDKDGFKKALTDIRKKGYASETEEYTLGQSCVAMPVFGANGKAAGAVSLTVNMGRLSPAGLSATVSEIQQTAMEISRRMGYLPEIKPI